MDFAIQFGADIVLIGLLILRTVLSAKKGFAKVVLTVAATIISFAVAVSVSEPIASWSYDTFLNPKVCAALDKNASGLKAAQTVEDVVKSVSKVMPHYLNTAFEDMEADSDDVSRRLDAEGGTEELTSQQISTAVVKPAAMVPLRLICAALCYAVLMIVSRLIIRSFHSSGKEKKHSALKKADRTLGAIFGFVRGLGLIFLISMLCGLIRQVTTSPEIKQVIEQSSIITICQRLVS